MKRTPRSASRRASRQFEANEPSFPQVPYRSRMCCGSLLMSSSSGTLVCMRKAISYWLMRVAISGSVDRSLSIRSRDCTASTKSRCAFCVTPAGFFEIEDGIDAAAEFDALKAARQKARMPLASGNRLFDAESAGGDHHHETGERLGLVP